MINLTLIPKLSLSFAPNQFIIKSSYQVLNRHKFHEKVKGKNKFHHLFKEFLEVLVQGSIDQWNDTGQMLTYLVDKQKSAQRMIFIAETQRNLLKFLPFSIFLGIPFAEALLPFYLYFFPNALPTTYIFDDQQIIQIILQCEDRLLRLNLTKDRKQMNSQRYLFQLVKARIPAIDMLRDAQEFSPKIIKDLIIEHQKDLQIYLHYENMDSEELVHLCKFFGMEFLRGTYILMKSVRLLLNLPIYIGNFFYWMINSNRRLVHINTYKNWNIPLIFPFEDMKRQLLLAQLKTHFRKIHSQDLALKKYGYEDLNQINLRSITRQRGMAGVLVSNDIKKLTFGEQKKRFHNDWIEFCDNKQVFDNSKLWYSILYYERFHSNIVDEYNQRVNDLIH